MQAIVFALIAYIGWGTSDIFGAISSRKIGGYSSTFWSFVLRVILFAVYIPFTLASFRQVTLSNIFISSVLAIALILGTAFFFEAFRSSNASLVGTIGAAFIVPTVILSVLFLHETLHTNQVVAISIIVIGLIFTTLDFDTVRKKRVALDKGIILALLAMVFWGVYFAFIKVPVKEIGWFLPNYIAYLFAPIILLIMKFKKIKIEFPTTKKTLLPLLGFTFLGSLGNFAFNAGVSKGFTSIVAPIAGAYPTLFVFLSFLVFKDKLKRQQLFGILISLTGIVMLSFFSA